MQCDSVLVFRVT